MSGAQDWAAVAALGWALGAGAGWWPGPIRAAQVSGTALRRAARDARHGVTGDVGQDVSDTPDLHVYVSDIPGHVSGDVTGGGADDAQLEESVVDTYAPGVHVDHGDRTHVDVSRQRTVQLPAGPRPLDVLLGDAGASSGEDTGQETSGVGERRAWVRSRLIAGAPTTEITMAGALRWGVAPRTIERDITAVREQEGRA